MGIRWGRIILAAVVAEVAAIAALIAFVALCGPRDAAAAKEFAERHGVWVGPIGGAVMCFLGGLLVARSVATNRILHGFLVGAATAVIDVALLIAAGAPFQLLFVASNVGRVMAGGLGGWAATRRDSASRSG
jgi:membrane glycosyltransferase